jgi:serine phosphatase RsbU (regulator of sigma subunit)/anti-sigma regulatory factor (Ser/Thr protein kinase)
VIGVGDPGDSPATGELSRERFLAEAATLLASSLDSRETLDRVAALMVPEVADLCSIELVENGSIRNVAVHHADPEKAALARRLQQERRATPDSPAGRARSVIRSGRAELYPSLGEGGREEQQLRLAGDLGLSTAIVAPLKARGQTIGALTLLGEGDRRFDERDLEFAQEIAGVAALALDNALLYEAQVRALADAEDARSRTARLQAVTQALSEATTRTDVARVLVREGLVAMRAHAGAVFVLGPDGTTFEALDSAGYPERLSRRWGSVAATADGPVSEAVARRELVAVESPEALRARWPRLAPAQRASGDRATLTAPLLVGDAAVGALHMAFRQARGFDDADRSFVQTLAHQCALALERARLYEEQHEAREQAERLAGRLRRLQTVIDATFTGGSLDELLEELLIRLREAVAGDTAAILIVDEAGHALVARKAIGFDGPTRTHVPIGQGFAGTIAATQTHLVVPDISTMDVVSPYFAGSGIVSLAGVPLVADGRLVGVVHVGSKRRREFDREDILLLRLVAGRAAVAIDRARAHEREHRIAESLQRSLLPERLPEVEGIEIAARYVPGTAGVAVGGDWYDVVELADGSIGIAVGDVVGHGVRAAATMGRLRNVLRAYALDGLGPAEALGRLNRLAFVGREETFATVVYALVAPSRTSVRIASAGHPPVLLRAPNGAVRVAEGGRSLPVGATPKASYAEADLAVDPGTTLVLYTDGLVERRSESIDEGIERLARLVEETDGSLDELADEIVARLTTSGHTDDVAFLAVHLDPVATRRLSLRLPAEAASLARLRSSLGAWLGAHGAARVERFDILVAVNEACANAVEHPLDASRTEVMLDAKVVGESVTIVVRDWGRWCTASPSPDRGRGLDLMSALMERVYVRPSEHGTRVLLRRRLRRGAE